jgi:hypothetical protein
VVVAVGGLLLTSALVCGVVALVYLTRADLRAGLSDAEADALAEGRWVAAVQHSQRPAPTALLTPEGRRLRRAGRRWAAGAAGCVLGLLALYLMVQRADI